MSTAVAPLAGLAIRVRRRSTVGFCIGMVALVAWLLAMYPSIRDNEAIKEAVAKYPKELLAFFGGTTGLDMTSPTGYLRMELLSFMAPVLLLILGVGAGASGIAGEEEHGTLELLLAQPVHRWRVLVDKALVVLHAVGMASFVFFLSLWIGAPIVGMDVAVSRLAAATVALATLAAVYGLLALAVGAATGRRALAISVATALAVVAYLVSSLSELIEWLRPLRRLSPFHQTIGLDPLATGFHPTATLAMLGIGVVAVAIGAFVFERRDVG